MLNRSRWTSACLTAGLVWVCCAVHLSAETLPDAGSLIRLPVVAGSEVRFTHLPLADGPARGSVTHIVQDDQGFLWFGTEDGLRRYDGYRFREYRHDPRNASSIGGNYIVALVAAQSGQLWIATDVSVDRYDPHTEQFTHYRIATPDLAIRHLSQDRQGFIWLSSVHGLDRLEPATGHITHYEHRPGDAATLGGTSVESTFEQRDGTFWVATEAGIERFDRGAGKVIDRIPVHGASNRLFEDHAGALWMISASAQMPLALVNARTNTVTRYTFQEGGVEATLTVRAIQEDRAGTLWLGTENRGLLGLDPTRQRAIAYRRDARDAAGLAFDVVRALFEDREGNFWVGLRVRGADRFVVSTLPFTRYPQPSASRDAQVLDTMGGVYEDGHGVLWVSGHGFLHAIDRGSGHTVSYTTDGTPGSISHSNVTAIVEDQGADLWFGTSASGLLRFNRRSGRFTSYLHDPSDPYSLSDDHVFGLFIDRRGTLWIGTEGSVSAWDRASGRFQTFREPVENAGGGTSRYQAFAEDSTGALWVGTASAGLRRLHPATRQFTAYRAGPRTAGGLSSDRVRALHVERGGVLWVGTDRGLNRFDMSSRTFRVYDEGDGLPSNFVNGILEDARGDLWLSTYHGLSRFDPRAGTFANYDVSDGIAANESVGINVASMNQGGEMFFASMNGVTAFSPNKIADDRYVPGLALTDFELFGKSVAVGRDSALPESISVARSLTLSHAQNVFTFEFALLSYASPERNRYRYRLEGLEPDWNETDSTHRFASYTTLPPGDYVFHVEAINRRRGAWNDSSASVRIHIASPWWSTSWFRSIGLALVLLGAWVAYRLRMRGIERHNRELARQVDERTVALRAANEDLQIAKRNADVANRAKSVFLANMSHELRTPLNAILGFSRLLGRRPLSPDVQADVSIIRDNGEHLLTLINRVLDLSKIESGRTTAAPSATDLYALLADVERTFALEAEQKHVPFRVERGSGVAEHVLIDQVKLREVLLNLVGNALKFTERGHVVLTVTQDATTQDGTQRLLFAVSDTGPGIAPDELATVFDAFVQSQTGRDRREGTGLGLTISYQYVKLMGGDLRLESDVGRGTTARFDIPVRLAGAAPAAIVTPRPIAIAPGQGPYRLLVADDASATRQLITRLLVPLGFEVREAADGAEALAIWREWLPHLIWMDMRMPVLDGWEATRRIKADPSGASTIIVAVTASGLDDPRDTAIAAGCDAFVYKPFEEHELIEMLQQRLGVRFIFADEPTVGRAAEGEDSLATLLAAVPAAEQQALHTAIVQLDVAGIERALRAIERDHPGAATRLRTLADNYQYVQLLRLFERVATQDVR